MVRIKDAVTYLGLCNDSQPRALRRDLLAMEDPEDLADVDPEQLQNHAQFAAAACKSLAGGRASPDDAWLAGLLHDIGYWVLVQECPDELARALELSPRGASARCSSANGRRRERPMREIGAYLLGLWGLPYPIVEAVALHHTPPAVTPARL